MLESSSSHILDSIEGLETNVNISDERPYLKEILKFKGLCKAKDLNIKPSWSGMNIAGTSMDQLEMNVQAERMINMFERLFEKMMCVSYINEFIKDDGDILRKYLKEEKVDFIMRTVNAHMRGLIKHTKMKMLFGETLNSDFEQIILYLTGNPCLLKYVAKINAPSSPFIRDLIEGLKRFYSILEKKLRITASEERNKDAMLKEAYIDYKDRLFTIERLQEKLDQQQHEMDIKLAQKQLLIEQYKVKLEELDEKFETKLQDLVSKSEKTMLREADQSENKQAILSVGAKESQMNYDNLLASHLNEEKLMRARKFKVEAQLATWISKFDQDVGERQNELDDIMAQCDSITEDIKDLEAMIREVDKVYNIYKAEKDSEDEAAFQAMLYKFITNRAARIIQTTWRNYRARKLAKKKKKGKGKGKGKGKK